MLWEMGWRNHLQKLLPSSDLASLGLALLSYLEHCGVGQTDDGRVAMMPHDRAVIMSWCLSEMGWERQAGYLLSEAILIDIRRFGQMAQYVPGLVLLVGGDIAK